MKKLFFAASSTLFSFLFSGAHAQSEYEALLDKLHQANQATATPVPTSAATPYITPAATVAKQAASTLARKASAPDLPFDDFIFIAVLVLVPVFLGSLVTRFFIRRRNAEAEYMAYKQRAEKERRRQLAEEEKKKQAAAAQASLPYPTPSLKPHGASILDLKLGGTFPKYRYTDVSVRYADEVFKQLPPYSFFSLMYVNDSSVILYFDTNDNPVVVALLQNQKLIDMVHDWTEKNWTCHAQVSASGESIDLAFWDHE